MGQVSVQGIRPVWLMAPLICHPCIRSTLLPIYPVRTDQAPTTNDQTPTTNDQTTNDHRPQFGSVAGVRSLFPYMRRYLIVVLLFWTSPLFAQDRTSFAGGRISFVA